MNILNIYIICSNIFFFMSKAFTIKNRYKYCDNNCMVCDNLIFTVLKKSRIIVVDYNMLCLYFII